MNKQLPMVLETLPARDAILKGRNVASQQFAAKPGHLLAIQRMGSRPRSNISLYFGDLWADRDESFVPTNSHSTGQAEVSSAPADLQAENQYFPFADLISQRLNMTFQDADQNMR
jgi:hypothetical protein